ncbi:hypothetical protein HMI54_009198 [Coelomomyces lativittatus]|nr:hypothetical protein HMI54_009198 [Coelomomyces lativittatus]KAJ1507803.1 hypothetical protein HMI55_000630 [Coelomomyces lativittatus]KAJ1511338.1 hypothetical protein HMI56_005515 [Coelomomyces lativittatus]
MTSLVATLPASEPAVQPTSSLSSHSMSSSPMTNSLFNSSYPSLKPTPPSSSISESTSTSPLPSLLFSPSPFSSSLNMQRAAAPFYPNYLTSDSSPTLSSSTYLSSHRPSLSSLPSTPPSTSTTTAQSFNNLTSFAPPTTTSATPATASTDPSSSLLNSDSNHPSFPYYRKSSIPSFYPSSLQPVHDYGGPAGFSSTTTTSSSFSPPSSTLNTSSLPRRRSLMVLPNTSLPSPPSSATSIKSVTYLNHSNHLSHPTKNPTTMMSYTNNPTSQYGQSLPLTPSSTNSSTSNSTALNASTTTNCISTSTSTFPTAMPSNTIHYTQQDIYSFLLVSKELQAAADFVSQLLHLGGLRNDILLSEFKTIFIDLMAEKFSEVWDIKHPSKGAGYRTLSHAPNLPHHHVDPLLYHAFLLCQMDPKWLFTLLPVSFSLTITPGLVAYTTSDVDGFHPVHLFEARPYLPPKHQEPVDHGAEVRLRAMKSLALGHVNVASFDVDRYFDGGHPHHSSPSNHPSSHPPPPPSHLLMKPHPRSPLPYQQLNSSSSSSNFGLNPMMSSLSSNFANSGSGTLLR